MVDLTAVRYLAWEDAFEVDFEDGLTFRTARDDS